MLLGMKGDLRTSEGSTSNGSRAQQMVDPAAAQELAKEIGEKLILLFVDQKLITFYSPLLLILI